jgi:hypothetical protein
MNGTFRFRPAVEHLEARESPAIVAVNGGGNTPNGTSADDGGAVLVASPDAGGENAVAIYRNVGGTWTQLATAGAG